MYSRQSRGFTLVELMITVAVVAVLATIAFPSFQATIRSSQVTSGHNEMIGLLNLARSDAIRNNKGGGVCGTSNGTTCDGSWSAGMMAFSDTSGNGAFENGETVLRYNQISPRLVVTGPAALIAFDGRGRRRAVADQVVTMRPAKCGTDTLLRTITINASGQVSSVKGACP